MVRSPVETIAPHAAPNVQFIRQSIKKRMRWKIVMESGVENGHLRYRRQQAAHVSDPREIHRIVQRSQKADGFHVCKSFLGYESRIGKLLSSMHDTMHDHRQI